MSLQKDYQSYQYERNLHNAFIKTPLKEGESCIKFQGKILVERQGNHPQPNHSIEVDKIDDQPVYKPNNGNAQGVYLSHFKTVYLTKHTRQIEKIPVPEIKEYQETPSFVLAELMTQIVPGITLGTFLDEVLINILKRSEYEKELRKLQRKGKLK